MQVAGQAAVVAFHAWQRGRARAGLKDTTEPAGVGGAAGSLGLAWQLCPKSALAPVLVQPGYIWLCLAHPILTMKSLPCSMLRLSHHRRLMVDPTEVVSGLPALAG